MNQMFLLLSLPTSVNNDTHTSQTTALLNTLHLSLYYSLAALPSLFNHGDSSMTFVFVKKKTGVMLQPQIQEFLHCIKLLCS